MLVFILSELGIVATMGGIGLFGKWIDYRKAAMARPKQVIKYLPESCFYNPPKVGDAYYLKMADPKAFEVVDERPQIAR